MPPRTGESVAVHPRGVEVSPAGRQVPGPVLELALAAHATLDPAEIGRLIVAGVAALVPEAGAVALYVLPPGSNRLEQRAVAGPWPDSAPVDAASDHPAARALRSETPLWLGLADGQAAAREGARFDDQVDWCGSAALAAPPGHGAVGVLCARFDHVPGAATRELLAAVARAVATAVANGIAHEAALAARTQLADIARRQGSLQVETELRARAERLLNDLHGAIHESDQPEEIIQLAVPRLCGALNASRCIGLLADPQAGASVEFRDCAHCEPEYPLDSSEVLWETSELVQEVERTGRPVVAIDRRELREYRNLRLELWQAPTSVLAVPAFREEKLAAIFVYHHCGGPRTWTEPEIDLACRAAEQVATALHNAHLYHSALAAEQFQRALVEVQSTVAQTLDLTAILEEVARHGMTLLGADAAYVWQVDEASRELVGVVGVGHRADRFPGIRTPLNRGRALALSALTSDETIVSNDTANDPRVNQRLRRMLEVRAALAVPLKARHGAAAGVLVFGFCRPGARIEADDVRRSQVLVNEAARAIEGAQLYVEARRRVKEWQVLSRISQAITEELDEEHIIRNLVEGTANILNVDACSLLVRDEEGGYALRHQLGLSPEHASALETLPHHRPPTCLAGDGAPHLVADLSAEGQYPPVAVRDGLRSLLSSPLVGPGGGPLGILTVYAGRDRVFTIEDLEALSTLASFGFAALSNASRYERQRRIALALQEPLHPQDDLPAEGLQIARRTLPALCEADIGGDYFDTISLEDGRLVVAIGDVCGKGLHAAVQTQSLRWMMRALVHDSPEPARLLTRLNRLLYQYTPAEGFVTLFYGLLDPARHRLRYGSAGHPPPLLLRPGDDHIRLLSPTGLVLGVDPTADYEEDAADLKVGDVLALFTDGVTEARSRGRQLEIDGVVERLRHVVASHEVTATRIADNLFESILRYADRGLTDDATLLILRRAGKGGARNPEREDLPTQDRAPVSAGM